MDISTQKALQALDTNKNDKGLTVRELKQLDKDNDNHISPDEAQAGGITSQPDLILINEKLNTAIASAQPNIDFDAFGISAEEKQAIKHQSDQKAGDHVLLFREQYIAQELRTDIFPHGMRDISPLFIAENNPKIGSESFTAALACMAKHRPERVFGMITDRTDSGPVYETYRVKFSGHSEELPIGKYNFSKGDNAWLDVLQSAGQKVAQATQSRTPPVVKLVTAPFKDTQAEKDIKALTGHCVDADNLSLTWVSTTREKMKRAFDNGRVVTAFYDPAADPFVRPKDTQHRYFAVLGYDAAKDTLLLQDLTGNGGPKQPDTKVPGGFFTLNCEDFDNYMHTVYYEQND